LKYEDLFELFAANFFPKNRQITQKNQVSAAVMYSTIRVE